MTVKQLIDFLLACDPNSDVLCTLSDDMVIEGKPSLRILDIDYVDRHIAVKFRNESDGTPGLSYEPTKQGAAEHVLLTLTDDF